MTRSIRCDVPIAAALILASPALLAAPAGRAPDAAEALFKEGRELVKAGDHAAGCPKLKEAFALRPTASVLLNIAKCHEREGKIATAWAEVQRARILSLEAEGAERHRELEEIAVQAISALEPRLPRLQIVIARPPPGLRVTRDGEALPPAALGAAIPVDPGRHEVLASAPGYRPETHAVILEEGKTATLELSLELDPPAAIGEPAQRSGGVPAWVWVSGGAGLALTGAGVYFLADDLSAISALREHCRTDGGVTTCDPGYDFESDNARKNRGLALAIGLGGAGIVALGASIIGLARALSPPRAEDRPAAVTATPWLAPGSAGATLSGRFW